MRASLAAGGDTAPAGSPGRADVVVVGAGPTGLALACALRARGVDVVVLEARPEPATTSRAAVVHAATLAALEPLGVTGPLVAAGIRAREAVAVAGRPARVLARVPFDDLPSRHPYVLLLSQATTEAVLAERLDRLGGAVRRGVAVDGVRRVGSGVAVTTDDGAQVLARYVVGADGLRSVVRDAAGIGFPGGRYPQRFVLADARLDGDVRDDAPQLLLTSGGVGIVAPLPGGTHRVVLALPPEDDDDAVEGGGGGAGDRDAPPGRADLQALLDERLGGVVVREVLWASRFRVHHRVADAFRRGPALLAGDAAHVHSPAGGQGMNLGLQDAASLGPVLADVLAGAAPEGGLDDWARRRRRAARQVVAMTDVATRVSTLRSPVLRAVRDLAVRTGGRVPWLRRRIARRIAGV